MHQLSSNYFENQTQCDLIRSMYFTWVRYYRNEIGNSGAEAIANALEKNTALRKIK